MLVEMASSINDKSKINTINLLEVPNQTFLEAAALIFCHSFSFNFPS